MLPYIALFVLIMILAYFADRLYEHNKKLSIALAIISILILAIFAGIRDYSVGTDVTNSRILRFESELTSSGTFFERVGRYHHLEYGYSFFNYIVSRFTSNYHVFLFAHQAILFGITYVIAFREKKIHKTRMWLTVLAYLLLWFNTSLNIMRQSIAIFIQLFAFKYIEKKDYKKYLLMTLLAGLFHTSSLVFAVMPLVNKLYQKNRTIVKVFCSIIIVIISFFFIETILSIATKFLPGLQRYEQYVVAESTNLSGRYLFYLIIMCFLLVLFDWVGQKGYKKRNLAQTNLLSMLSIYNVVFYALSGFIMYGYRMSYFFLAHNIIYIPRIESNLNGNNKKIFVFVVVLLLIGYWINRFILSHYDGTLPYMIDSCFI